MGAIPEYQRQQFASTYVGGAQRDDSGALIAGAVQDELVEPERKKAMQRLDARTSAIVDLQANNAIIRYGLDYQTGLAQLQKDYADNTAAYPEAAVEYGRKLSEEQAKAIADEQIRTKFQQAASTIQKQSVAPAMAWAVDKNEYNANVAFDDSLQTITRVMGNTTTAEAYKFNRPAFDDLDKLASGIVDDKRRTKLVKDGHEASIKAHLDNRVMEDAEGLLEDIRNEKYDDIPEFTSTIKAQYASKADSRIRANRIAKKIAQDDKVNELSLAVMSERDPTIIDRIKFAAKEDEIPDAKANTLISAVLTKTQKAATDIAKAYPQADKYLQLAKKFIDNDIERAEFQLEVIDIWRNGGVDPYEGTRWAKLKNDVSSLKGANDKIRFDANLKAVLGFAEGVFKGASNKQGVVKIAGALKMLMANVLAAPGPDGVGEDDVADKTIAQVQATIDPRRTQYEVGDSIPNPNGGAPGKVTGFYPNGTPAVTYQEE